MNLFILFHPSTRYSPDTNLGLLPKPAARPFYRSGCQRRDPAVCSKCSVAILAANVLIPYLLATYSHIKQCSQNKSKVAVTLLFALVYALV